MTHAAQVLTTVESDFNILGGLAKGAVRRALDAEIAGEGAKVIGDGTKIILSDGTTVAYTPPPEDLPIPDMSKVKSIRHYFGAKGYRPYPAWLYHEDGQSVLVRDHKESAEYGVVYRQTNEDERQRYGVLALWDWEKDCKWRPKPWKQAKIDFKDHAGTKNLVTTVVDPHATQRAMVADVVAAVTQVLRMTPGAASAPAAVDPKDWEEFQKFVAWKKANEVVAAEMMAPSEPEEPAETPYDAEVPENALANALPPEMDRMLWEEEAKKHGIKVDGRWSIERLKGEVQKAMDAPKA